MEREKLELLYKQKSLYRFLPNLKSDILFSIIIPVYNSEKYLFQCIQSVLNQKYSNLEIIIVDDYSTDKSIEIIRSFAKKYNNIKIICNKKNEGVSVCRNKGITNAVGKYIIFLDNDDYLINNGLKKLANLIQNNNGTNLVIFTHYTVKVGNKFVKHKNIFQNNLFDSKISESLNINQYIYCWNYVFERNFIIKEKLQFLSGVSIGEDRLFVYRSLCCCKKFIFYKEHFYCHRLGGKLSLRKQKASFNVCVDYLKIINEMCKLIIKKKLPNKKKKFIFKEMSILLMQIIPVLTLISQNEIFKLSKIIQKNLKNFKLLKIISTKKSIYFFVMKYGAFNGLINYRNFVIEEIKLLVKNLKFKEIYIFSKAIYGIAIANQLLRSDYPIKGFFDNNKIFDGSYVLGLKVTSPLLLKKKSKKELSKILVIISNQEKVIIQSIRTQLEKSGLKKRQNVNKNFHALI